MRRPAFCSGATTADDDCYCSGPLVPRDNGGNGKDEGRLARVKRMLAGTLSMGRRGRVFGTSFDELPVGKEGVPKIAVRLCGYIENYGLRCGGLFRLSAGNPKLVERLRVSFDRTGEADLEAAGDPQSVASLLKLWLRELPEPIIIADVAEELMDIQEKFHEDLPEWRTAVGQILPTLPEANLRLLHYILRFLHHCASHGAAPSRCRHAASAGVEAVFSPLLIRDSLVGRNETATQLVGKMIQEMKHIFSERFVEHAYQSALGGWSGGAANGANNDQCTKDGAAPTKHQRKRKERHESFNSQTQERKVIRSNSEERPLETNDKDTIRRVSSHEDFSGVRTANKNKGGFLSEFVDPTVAHDVRISRPLHEHNSPAVSRHPSVRHADDAADALDEEHERRRSTERSARTTAQRGRRNVTRRKKAAHGRGDRQGRATRREGDGGSGSSKENEDEGEAMSSVNQQLTPVSSSTSDDDTCRGEHKPHAFLQLHPQEKERSPSPSSSSPSTPHLDLTSLHGLVDCNEPLKSRNHWSFSHRQTEEDHVTSQAMLSPRTSLVFPQRSGGLDPTIPPSPPQEHNSRGGMRGQQVLPQDLKMKQLNKQISSVKRKLKRFEEDFELEFGYRPSHADKMGNRDVKNLGADLNKLRKEMKLLKEDSVVSRMAKPTGLVLANDELQQSKAGSSAKMEDIMQEVEQNLSAKRQAAGRPADVDSLTRDQLLDEKVALQKGLLYLESVFGRPVTRAERDVVRPLYDRYRTLKRMVVRTCSSKLKDSISELATILEHETMDFTSLPPQPPAADDDVADGGLSAMVPLVLPVAAIAAADTVAGETSTAQLENLHSLPLSNLLDQQRSLRESKKQLRRSLREFEDDFQRRTGKKLQREDRMPMESVYVAYKQAKAKLRLLEALVSKHSVSPVP